MSYIASTEPLLEEVKRAVNGSSEARERVFMEGFSYHGQLASVLEGQASEVQKNEAAFLLSKIGDPSSVGAVVKYWASSTAPNRDERLTEHLRIFGVRALDSIKNCQVEYAKRPEAKDVSALLSTVVSLVESDREEWLISAMISRPHYKKEAVAQYLVDQGEEGKAFLKRYLRSNDALEASNLVDHLGAYELRSLYNERSSLPTIDLYIRKVGATAVNEILGEIETILQERQSNTTPRISFPLRVMRQVLPECLKKADFTSDRVKRIFQIGLKADDLDGDDNYGTAIETVRAILSHTHKFNTVILLLDAEDSKIRNAATFSLRADPFSPVMYSRERENDSLNVLFAIQGAIPREPDPRIAGRMVEISPGLRQEGTAEVVSKVNEFLIKCLSDTRPEVHTRAFKHLGPASLGERQTVIYLDYIIKRGDEVPDIEQLGYGTFDPVVAQKLVEFFSRGQESSPRLLASLIRLGAGLAGEGKFRDQYPNAANRIAQGLVDSAAQFQRMKERIIHQALDVAYQRLSNVSGVRDKRRSGLT